MKNLIFAITGLLLFSVGSCQKEEFKPNNQQDDIERNIIIDDFGGNKSNGNGDQFSSVRDSLRNITDPNRDEDEERRAKRK